MILAAGKGTRLQPLTEHTPKPLIEVGGKPLILHTIESLRNAGFIDIVINVGYLGKQIIAALGDGQQFGVSLHFSIEPAEPLETGGGIFKALPLLGDNPFLVVSGDIFTDYPFVQLRRQSSCEFAHLVMVDNPIFHKKGDYALDNGKIVMEANKPRFTYANIGVLSPNLFNECQAGIYPFPPLLKKPMAQGKVTGEYFNGIWHNVGSIQELTALRHSLNAMPSLS